MSLDRPIYTRVNSQNFKIFEQWCSEAKTTPADIIREVIEKVPQGKVKIQKTEIKNQKLKELYE